MGDTKPPSHPHAMHRERVRNLFLKSGLEGFSDHNVLELLLFYAIPQRDTNLTAHRLIDRFGTLRNVLDAPVEELCKVQGMGLYSATFLSILPQLFRRYNEDGRQIALQLSDENAAQAIRQYLCARYIGEAQESVYLLSFGADGRMIACTNLARGSSLSVAISERLVLETVIRLNAASVVLAHNHPGGVAAPSKDDVDVTRQVADALNRIDVRLIDHLIVAGGEAFSMASNIKFRSLFLNT